MRYLLTSALVLACAGCPGEYEPPEPLDITVRVSRTQVEIRNGGQVPYTDCRVTLNAGALGGGGYSQDVARIPAGDPVTGGLSAFLARDGERFNPATHAVREVSVACSEGIYVGRFD